MPRQKHSSEQSEKVPQRKENPHLSVVVPVFNEEACLEEFFARLIPVLEDLQESYEVIFINDGSRDQ
ncbi:MAG: glycosyltransferase, partial [Holosporales bacterium]|nr:glycosyltransferase [Holosporales bacterium]